MERRELHVSNYRLPAIIMDICPHHPLGLRILGGSRVCDATGRCDAPWMVRDSRKGV
ncbi:MAG: hypothetical protein P8020_22035 [Acidobacteriota bacterium]